MPDDRKRVLIVDQDRFSSLISKMLVGRFQPETASDGPSAVSALRDNPPDVLVVEESVGGIRLAELVGMSPKYDHIPVILTSSHPSPDSIIRSRNAGISTFLAKPFRPSDLHTRIQAALEETQSPDVGDSGSSPEEDDSVDPEEREQQTQSLRDRVKQIDGLPSFPATHAEITKLARSDDATSDDLAEKIQLDPSFLAQVLKLVLDRYFSDYYGAVIEAVDTNNQTILAAELDLLGVGHEEIGGQLASAWNFSENYAACIEHHHNPPDTRRFTRLVYVIHIADCLCRQLGFGSGGDSVVPEISDETLDHFSMDDRGMQILTDAAKSDIDDADSFLSALAN